MADSVNNARAARTGTEADIEAARGSAGTDPRPPTWR